MKRKYYKNTEKSIGLKLLMDFEQHSRKKE